MQYDIVIIGGGLVGAALARNLALQNIPSLVIDNQIETALYSAALDNRGIALSYSSIQILQQLGLWHELQNVAHAIKDVHISEQGKFGFTKLESSKHDVSALGYVISASDLGRALVHNLAANKNIAVLRPVTLTELCYDASAAEWHLTLNTQQISAKLLIAADGTNSLVRKYCNVIGIKKDYQQTAIICNIHCQQKITAIAFERFTAQGVLALLPFGNKVLKCVLTVANNDLAELMSLSDPQYLQLLQQLMGYRAGVFCSSSVRKTFPIMHLGTPQLTAPGAILIGNAANTLHPVAAQGLSLGLRDVLQLTKLIHKYSVANDLTNAQLLAEYNATRSKDHQQTQHFTNSIVEIFSHKASHISSARSLGLLAAQFIPGLKQKIITQGAGIWQ